MIVNEGRKMLLEAAFTDADGKWAGDETPRILFSLFRVFISSNDDLTRQDMKYSDIKIGTINTVCIDNNKENNDSNLTLENINESKNGSLFLLTDGKLPENLEVNKPYCIINDDTSVRIVCKFKNLPTNTYQSAGLVYLGESKILFSRINFQPVSITENTEYLLDYYIYF